MKVVIPGGSGHIGGILARAFRARGEDVVILSRHGAGEARSVAWDARTLGPWAAEIDGADVVINLAGRLVHCRYSKDNLAEMLCSRVDSTRAVGQAIERASRPPRVWLQMSTATIYAHRFDAPNDEDTGVIGGGEPGAARHWDFSIEIGKAWERAQGEARTPATRKVALRSALVMSSQRGAVFDILLGLVRAGLGGSIAGGRQFVSWIHEDDFVRAVDFLVAHEDLAGPVNVAAPNPLPQRDFMAALRDSAGRRLGLPCTRWMAAVGAFVLGTDTELVLKSRRVAPTRLLEAGFRFQQPDWPGAARNLVGRWRAARQHA